MNHIFVNYIIDFIPESDIKPITLVCNHINIEKKRKKMNKKKAMKLTHVKIQNQFKSIPIDAIKELLNTPDLLLQSINYLKDDLLNEYSIPFKTYNYRTMLMKKYVSSFPIYYFNHNMLLEDIVFESNPKVFKNVYVCSTYRLPPIHRRMLISSYPYAKALIY